MTTHDDLPYIKHILDNIQRLEESTENKTKQNLKNDDTLLQATIRRIEVIGEAAKNISAKLKANHPEIEWKKIIGTRDIFIHAYFQIDLGILWDIVKNDIPILKKQIEGIKKDLDT
tara:strand:+ start:910 stop:1257 length:348 start_codon:yes stop_codon:yes gene_type:complete